MDQGKKGLYLIIPEKAHYKLKKLAVKRKISMTDVILEWIKEA